MSGSEHFIVYEHNLRRLLLLDWLRDEQIQRRFAVEGSRQPRDVPRQAERPYWLVEAESLAAAG